MAQGGRAPARRVVVYGTMNPEVVNIFKRWGFRWGGDWTYTDPMHFELAALLDVPKG